MSEPHSSNKKKKKINFGFTPKSEDTFTLSDINSKQALLLALEAAKALNWRIGTVYSSGFKAYTPYSWRSWSEEVNVDIDENQVRLSSICTGNQMTDWGKNRKNIEQFKSFFTQLLPKLETWDIEEKLATLIGEDESVKALIDNPLKQKEKSNSFLSLIIPSEGFIVTPIIVWLNILVFVLMLVAGVHWFAPLGQDLMNWGANFAPLTTSGQWWRLLSSTFLHIGILHLLVNMWALLYIGVLLEPMLGTARYLSAYLIAGIAGSITSAAWNDLTISAGASGAIFGMYGLFLVLLTTKLIEKSARKTLFYSIGAFVLFNLSNGMNPGIDNAAHLGGLLTGAICGFAFVPSLTKPNPQLKSIAITLLALGLFFTGLFVFQNDQNDIKRYQELMAEASQEEQMALSYFQMDPYSNDAKQINKIQYECLPALLRMKSKLEQAGKLVVPDGTLEANKKMIAYCVLYEEFFELALKGLKEETEVYDQQMEEVGMKINELTQDLMTNYLKTE